MRMFTLSKVLGRKNLEFALARNWLGISTWFSHGTLAFLVVATTFIMVYSAKQREAIAADITLAQETRCYALTIYWEAERRNIIDKVAVAQNILERMESGHYPATICGVVNQVRKHHVTKADTAMYSYIFDGRQGPGLDLNMEWEISERVAREMLADWKANGRNYTYFREVRQLVSYSVNYHAEMKQWPIWATADVNACRFKPLGKVGAHFHYADFRRADAEGHAKCITALNAAKQRNRLAAR